MLQTFRQSYRILNLPINATLFESSNRMNVLRVDSCSCNAHRVCNKRASLQSLAALCDTNFDISLYYLSKQCGCLQLKHKLTAQLLHRQRLLRVANRRFIRYPPPVRFKKIICKALRTSDSTLGLSCFRVANESITFLRLFRTNGKFKKKTFFYWFFFSLEWWCFLFDVHFFFFCEEILICALF